jgi:hypothetical protein
MRERGEEQKRAGEPEEAASRAVMNHQLPLSPLLSVGFYGKTILPEKSPARDQRQ